MRLFCVFNVNASHERLMHLRMKMMHIQYASERTEPANGKWQMESNLAPKALAGRSDRLV